MTDIEKQIVELIETNPHLSEDLKKRYLLALFLMDSKEQSEYLNLVHAFTYRCNTIERGIYIVREDEKTKIMRTLEDVKKDILEKIHSNNQ